MTAFLAKNQCRKFFLFWNLAILAGILVATPGVASAATPNLGIHYKLEFNSRLDYHTFNPRDVASHRHYFEMEQTATLPPQWTMVGGFRAYAESAFATNDERYNAPVRRAESQEFALRDLYFQYKGPRLLVRAGNQQVVWGEAFGFYYADIVNPKDTRQFGLWDLNQQRIPVPMINSILFIGGGSLQFVYLPKTYVNISPAPGNDYAFPFGTFGPNPVVNSYRALPTAFGNSEVGVRASGLVNGFDLATFLFYYHDRSPSYHVTSSPTQTAFDPMYPRMTTFGFTGSKDWGDWLTRFEAIYTKDRPFDSFTAPAVSVDPLGNVTTSGGYATTKSDEWTGVLGIDYTKWESWRTGFQFSHQMHSKEITGSFVRRNATSFSFNVAGPVVRDHSVEVIYTYEPQSGSSLLRASYLIPASSQFEVVLGTILLVGGSSSQFGRYQEASRAYVLVKAYFGG